MSRRFAPCRFAAAVPFVAAATACITEGTASSIGVVPVAAAVTLVLDDTVLPPGRQGQARVVALDGDGRWIAEPAVTWRIAAGSASVVIDSEGRLTSHSPGRATIEAVVDSVVATATVSVVEGGVPQGPQAPAEPRIRLDFPMPEVTGRSIVVTSGSKLQSALNGARAGDEFVLTAGVTYEGNYVLPKRPAGSRGWVTVRSDRTGQLPPIGMRVTPMHAPFMPRIVTPNSDPAIRTESGASGWRLIGLEVTVTPEFAAQNYGLVILGDVAARSLDGVAADLVLDRLYIHGQPSSQVSRCLALHSARTQVSDSWLDECHGRGFDSQAIWGGNGPGPYRIANNTLRGAGENIMFGGDDPAIPGLVPSDIEIVRNQIDTPLAWKGKWSKKNLLELKNAARVLIEANVLDGSWVDGQTGWAIVLKSTNQSGRCRWCRTTDVTIRRTLVRNAGAGINVAAHDDNPDTDTTTRRILVTETVLDGIGVAPYDGDRRGFQILNGTSDIAIDRTVLAGNLVTAMMLEPQGGGARRTRFRESVWARGLYGVIATDRAPGGPSLSGGAPGALWTGMAFVGDPLPGFPVGTAFVRREPDAFRSVQIRRAVQSATEGVVIPQ